MGQTEATMALLRTAVWQHRRSLWGYLGTHTTHAESGMAHVFDRESNPHHTTKDQVGLGHLENYPIAELIAEPRSDRYLDLQGAITMVTSKMGQALIFKTPIPLTPADKVTISTTQPLFSATGYRNAYDIPRAVRRWRVEDMNSDEYWDEETVTDTWVPSHRLKGSSEYRWSVCDVAEDGSRSQWAPWQECKTPAFHVDMPHVSDPDTTGQGSPIAPFFQTSAFSADSPQAEHERTLWTLYQGNDPTPVWSLDSPDAHLTSVSLPDRLLRPDTPYRMEVIHVGRNRGASDPGIREFSTRKVTVSTPYIGLRGQIEAAPPRPVFDIPPRFGVVGDQDTLERVELAMYQGDLLVWSDTYASEPGTVTYPTDLLLGTQYRLTARYVATHYGHSDVFERSFTTTTGGSRGYLSSVPRTPDVPTVSVVAEDNQWLDMRSRQFRSHRYGEVLWSIEVMDIDPFTITWAAALDAYLVLYVPRIGSHRLVVGQLSREGSWTDVLVGVNMPSGTVVSEMVFHGVIDNTYRFSATTSKGVCYFYWEPAGPSKGATLLSLPDTVEAQGRFMTTFGTRWVAGLLLDTPGGPQPALLSHDTATNVTTVRSYPTTGAVSDWGYRTMVRDVVSGQVIVDRGDQSVRVGSNATMIDVWDLAPLGELPPFAGLRLSSTTSLVHRISNDIGFGAGGLVRYNSQGNPSELAQLVGPQGPCSVSSGALTADGQWRLHMTTPDGQDIYLQGFDYVRLTEGVIPDLVDYSWTKVDLNQLLHGPETATLLPGTVSMVGLPTLDSTALLDDLRFATTTPPEWDSLVGFHQ